MVRLLTAVLLVSLLGMSACASKKIVAKNCEKQNDGFYVCETP